MKKIDRLVWITAACTLLPMVVGLILWSRLPDSIPTHFGIGGEADGWSSKAFAVFGMPAFLLGIHLVCAFVTRHDPRGKNISDLMWTLVLWICPAIGLYVTVLTYGTALGLELNADLTSRLVIGALFVIIGNYLPKCRQNYTIGIKLPWTLADEDNWNRTHRLGGVLWVIGGLVVIVSAFLPGNARVWAFLGVVLVITLVPTVCSFLLYQKKEKDGEQG